MLTNRKMKKLILAAVSAAVLAACGGGGSGGAGSALSTGSTSTASGGSSNNNSGSGSASSAATAAQNTGDLSALEDVNPLPPLNPDTPLHTSFISSSDAQQNNPNVQLRKIDGANSFTYNQGGLISSLEFNKNAEVKLDGVVIANNGDATKVSFPTPHSVIAKVFSGGFSREDVRNQDGSPTPKWMPGKASFDEKIVELYNEIEEAKKVLKSPDADAAAKAEAQEKIQKLEPVYNDYRGLRSQLTDDIQKAGANIAYFKKDKNGLVFDKSFDGVYIVRFADNTQVVLQDPAAAGWTHQTFAYYTDPKNGVIQGYQSLGAETKFTDLPTSGTATYKGLSVAHLMQNGKVRELTSEVKAIADFARKGIRFETSKSTFHDLNNGIRTSTADKGFDMKGTATWSNSNQFGGSAATANNFKGDLKGKFYGASAAEIGGVYGLKNADGSAQLIGGYGAKRQ